MLRLPLAPRATGVSVRRSFLALCRQNASVAAYPAARSIREMPGPKAWPVLGTIPDFVKRAGYDLDKLDTLAVHDSYYKEFGPTYLLNLPPFGNVVVVSDPREFLQIFQSEGKYPRGASQYSWPFKHFCSTREYHTMMKINLHGEVWRDYRLKFAKDMSGPPAARDYLPAICEAARLASSVTVNYADRFDEFASRLSFDMFGALALGRQMQTTNEAVADPADLKFVLNSIEGFSSFGKLVNEPHRRFMPGGLLPHYLQSMDAAAARSRELAEGLVDLIQASADDSSEMRLVDRSYIAKLTRRGDLTTEEIIETLMMLLNASVDTTSHVFSWLLLNLAQHPDKQERLRTELRSVLGSADLHEQALKRLPYLKACIRESHRHTPPSPVTAVRPAPKTMNIGGFEIPAGTIVMLNGASIQKDPAYFPEDFGSFNPERWLPEQVDKRRGGPSSLMDHVLLSAPFGFGARMCPGSRVATLEIQAATCRLIQDHRLELEPGQTWVRKQGAFIKADPFPRFRITPV